jgi:hypothetical protein
MCKLKPHACLEEKTTYQDEMEVTNPPLRDCLFTVIGNVIANSLPLHKRRQDRLIDRVVYRLMLDIGNNVCTSKDIPSTMSTLMGGIILLSGAFPFLPRGVVVVVVASLSELALRRCCRRRIAAAASWGRGEPVGDVPFDAGVLLSELFTGVATVDTGVPNGADKGGGGCPARVAAAILSLSKGCKSDDSEAAPFWPLGLVTGDEAAD